MSEPQVERLLVGAMSGTSADGVDVALVRIVGSGRAMRATLLTAEPTAFSADLRGRVLAVRATGHTSLRALAELTRDVTLAYAGAVERLLATSETKPADVAAVAAHGQTLFHDPPLTIQQFDPALLASRCGIDVVSDFRRADCAAGGQGAPLVPWADFFLFGGGSEPRVILNLGGIANVTLLPGGDDLDGVTGFDVGPGNCLSDWVLRDHGGIDHGGIDDGGRLALSGTANAEAVERFLADDYVRRPPPKSTDGPAMVAIFERATGGFDLSRIDLLATAAEIVAQCVLRQTPAGADLIVAGGGVHNAAIMAALGRDAHGRDGVGRDALARGRPVRTTDALGVPAQSREAMAFALLGAATLDRVPANLPRVTGASRAVVLGAVTPRAG